MVIRRIVAAAAAALVVAALVPSSAGAAQQGLWWQSTWQMPQVWQLTDGTGVTVAVIDSGVDASTPERAGAVVPGTDFYDQGGDGTADHDADQHGTGMAMLGAEELGHAAPTGPALPEPPTVGSGDGSGGSALPVLLAVAGVVLLAAALLTVLLVTRASRRRQQKPYPAPAPTGPGS